MNNRLDKLRTYVSSRHLGFTDICPDCKGQGEVHLTKEECCECPPPCCCDTYKTCGRCDGDGRIESIPPGKAGEVAIKQMNLIDDPLKRSTIGTGKRGKKPFLVNGRLSKIQSVLYKNVIGTDEPFIIRPAPPGTRWLRKREKVFEILDWLKLKWFNLKLRFFPQEIDDPLYDLMNEDSIIPAEEWEPLHNLAQEVVDTPGSDPTEIPDHTSTGLLSEVVKPDPFEEK